MPEMTPAPRADEQRAYRYIRAKVDQMLDTIGTLPLKPDELDDESLLSIDPIGIISESFKHILNHLEETNQRLMLAHDEIHAILNSAGAAILVVDPEGRIVAGNSRINDFFNPDARPLQNALCRDILCREKEPPPDCILQKVLNEPGGEQRNEVVLNGRCYEAVGTAIHDHQNQQLSHVVILYTDITSRITNELTLRQTLATAKETQDQLNGILSASGDGLLVTDRSGQIQLMNRTAAELLQIPAESTGKTLRRMLGNHSLLWPECLAMIDEGRATGGIDITIGDGAEQGVLAAKISLLPQEGALLGGAVIALRDVTRERSIERMKSEFVATAAHEFRTPLTAIVGFSELILNEDFTADEQREFISLMHEKAVSLSRIVNNLLDISRIEAGEELALSRTPTRLRSLLDRTVPFFITNNPNHQITREGDDDMLLDVDPEAITQVLENILGNAIKYSPQGGAIRIVCAHNENRGEITIHDQGIGMTREQLERVFDKFYRGNAQNTAIRGTGLGMTIVKHFVEEHGGTICIHSKPGNGTSVHVTLPLATEAGKLANGGGLRLTSSSDKN